MTLKSEIYVYKSLYIAILLIPIFEVNFLVFES